MKDALHLDFSARRTPASLVRKVHLKRDSGGPATEIMYEIAGGNPEFPKALDGFLFGALLFVMGTGLPLRVHGPVSRSALYNLEDVQAFWRLWRPERYKRVEIVPDQVVDLKRCKPGRRAIAAFSGGVDSTFTVLRHRNRTVGSGSYNLDTALMVHGFDINLGNRDAFERAAERAMPFLEKMGVALRVIRTTSKELGLQNWEDSHAGQLAGCLHQFSDEFEFGLIGSTASYADPELPYGSNPVLDHLLSGDEFGIIYDAAGFLKTDKIAALAEDPVATAGLRVCWQGSDQYRNCGRCGKCVRTRLSFLAAGVPNPACFDGDFELGTIDTIRLANVSEWTRMKEISAYAAQRGIKAAWVRRLHRRMATFRRELFFSNISKTMGRSLDRIGMKQGVKRGLRTLGLMR